MQTGTLGHLGKTAMFRCKGIDILLAENGTPLGDREVFWSNG